MDGLAAKSSRKTNAPCCCAQWFQIPRARGCIGWPVFNGWKSKNNARPLRLNDYVAYMDQEDVRQLLTGYRIFWQEMLCNGHAELYVPGIWPGFDDKENLGLGRRSSPDPSPGWKDLRHDMGLCDRRRTCLLCKLVTWNDWYEGTILEPTAEFGDTIPGSNPPSRGPLQKNPPPTHKATLNCPVWIYRIRKIDARPHKHSN